MTFAIQDIEKLAALTRLELSKKEKEKFAEQISSILDYVRQIQEVDTTKVKDFSHHQGLANIWRDDKKQEFKNVRKIIDQFPDKAGNLNKVKAVFE